MGNNFSLPSHMAANHLARLAIAAAPPSRGVRIVLALTALLAVAGPVFVVFMTEIPDVQPVQRGAPRTASSAIAPKAEPLAFQNVAPEDARAINAAVPFSKSPNPAARPYFATGEPASIARADDCLAAAMLYEAGDDANGERAVAQVILNRLRHPAFPKTVCGVVFEGAERRTGCQFTFTCDGALARHHWSNSAWERARRLAIAALTGQVFAPVGYATHYHTDWVVPYWSESLDKITAVGAHLFFRWAGWWGTPPAFMRAVDSHEPTIAALAPFSPAHQPGGSLSDAALTPAPPPPARPSALDADVFMVALDPALPPASYPAFAQASCGVRDYCKFLGWPRGVQIPASLPLDTRQIAALRFSYLRDHARGLDKYLWNCAQTPRDDPHQCMKNQALPTPQPLPSAPAPLTLPQTSPAEAP